MGKRNNVRNAFIIASNSREASNLRSVGEREEGYFNGHPTKGKGFKAKEVRASEDA